MHGCRDRVILLGICLQHREVVEQAQKDPGGEKGGKRKEGRINEVKGVKEKRGQKGNEGKMNTKKKRVRKEEKEKKKECL